MNKEFVTYEQALALKELGFDEESFGHYRTYGKNLFYATPIARNLPARYRVINAPLYQQAFRWFREKHGLIYSIGHMGHSNTWAYEIINISMPGPNYGYAQTYEEAEQACLEKLIEIVKEKTQ